MLIQLYTIRDLVAEESGPIFQVKNEAAAIRHMRNVLKSEVLNPLDYELLYLGDYETEETLINLYEIKSIDFLVDSPVNLTEKEIESIRPEVV